MTTASALTAGALWELVEAPDVVVHDMYDEVGGPHYAALCASDRHEVPELVAAVRATRGSVLELAAGAGRLTMPLLAAGRAVVATELSPTMIRLLEERLSSAPRTLRERCEVRPADMRSFDLGRRFGAVVLGTTSISLLDAAGRAAMFERVRAHLEPDGAFLVTTLDPDQHEGAGAPTEHVIAGADGTGYVLAERASHDRTSREVALAVSLPGSDGGTPTICRSTVGMLTAELLVAEATQAGFALASVVLCAGDERGYRTKLLTFVVDGAS